MSLHPDPTRLDPQTAEPAGQGRISLVGAGPGAADLLTRRALARIMAADVVFHDRLVSAEVLALIPPQCRRVDVGKTPGGPGCQQEAIDAAIVAAARQGLAVVRLKSGDPSIFGRAGEELAAARAAGLDVEIVPGITAASAAAAALGEPLTERGRFDRLLIATGTAEAGGAVSGLAQAMPPGTRLALYMAIQRIGQIEADLLAGGLPPDTAVTAISHAGTGREQVLRCHLAGLAGAIRQAGLRNPAIILVDHPSLTPAPAVQALAAR